jgi:phage gp29-like protein
MSDLPVPVDKATLSAKIIVPDYIRFFNYLPNPDEVLRGAGQFMKIYREMDTDSRIKSLMNLVKSSAGNIPVRILQGESSSDCFDFVKKNLVPRIPGLIKELLGCLDFGFLVDEIVWEERDGWYTIKETVPLMQERFFFDWDGQAKWASANTPLTEPYKWLIAVHDRTPENPYGNSMKKACYWPWKFKTAGMEFWLMATERFSVPSLLALFDNNDEANARKKALEISELLTEVSSGSGGALANIKDVKSLEMGGSLDHFKVLCEFCDTQISQALAGAALAVQESQFGTKAHATVHEDRFYEQAADIARELEPVIQTLCRWMVELNFGLDAPVPTLVFDLEDFASWEIVRDALDRGVPVSKKALYERYGIPAPEDPADSFVSPNPAPASSAGPGISLADEPGKKKAPWMRRRI